MSMMPPMPVPPLPITPQGSYNNPLPHCNLRQVQSLLRGLKLTQFADSNGLLDCFWEDIVNDFIPEATDRAVRYCRTNFDYSKEIWFFDGPNSQEITLPRRFVNYVNACFLRFIPSQVWYRFLRPRLINGEEFSRLGLPEPPVPPPETIPPTPLTDAFVQGVDQVYFTGTEDADLYVDNRRRTIMIPPRVLYATVAVPQSQFNFFPGTMNVEVHFAYGFPPTKYTDGQPLSYDPVTGLVLPLSPIKQLASGGTCGQQPIDWSSGMPQALSKAVARLVYADVLRRLWVGITGGLSSMSVDGASESYGSSPFGGTPDEIEAQAFQTLRTFGIAVL